MIIDNTLLKKQWRQQDYFVTNSPNIDKVIAMRFTSNTIVFGFCIGHVETLRLFNNPEQSDQSWGFGQVSMGQLGFDDLLTSNHLRFYQSS